MEDEAQSEACSAKVIVDLSRRGAVELVRRLDFDHQFPVHNYIESLARNCFTPIEDWDVHLATNRVPAISQLTF